MSAAPDIVHRRPALRLNLLQAAACEHCGEALGILRGDGTTLLHIRSRAIVLRNGRAETNCHFCKRSTRLPLVTESAA